ncbi:MAG: hypothetical protein ACK4RS_06440, partial [Thiothrix sp.]
MPAPTALVPITVTLLLAAKSPIIPANTTCDAYAGNTDRVGVATCLGVPYHPAVAAGARVRLGKLHVTLLHGLHEAPHL